MKIFTLFFKQKTIFHNAKIRKSDLNGTIKKSKKG